MSSQMDNPDIVGIPADTSPHGATDGTAIPTGASSTSGLGDLQVTAGGVGDSLVTSGNIMAVGTTALNTGIDTTVGGSDGDAPRAALDDGDVGAHYTDNVGTSDNLSANMSANSQADNNHGSEIDMVGEAESPRVTVDGDMQGLGGISGDAHIEDATVTTGDLFDVPASGSESADNDSVTAVSNADDGASDGAFDDGQGAVFVLTDIDLMQINPDLFSFQPVADYQPHRSQVVTIRVEETEIRVHLELLRECSAPLYTKFTNNSMEAQNQYAIIGDGKLGGWMVLLLAMYGTQTHVLPRNKYTGVDIAEAMVISNKWDAEAFVMNDLSIFMQKYFSAFQQWKAVPILAITQNLHRTMLEDVNDTFVRYKQVLHPKKFPDQAFAILIKELCPMQVYATNHTRLDPAIHRSIAYVSMRADAGVPYTVSERMLWDDRFIIDPGQA